MKIVQMDIGTLNAYAKNARKHSEKQIKRIANSIKEFGFLNPVLVDKDNTVIAGHGRIDAAKLLKLKKIPTISVMHLTKKQVKAYIIADNRLAEMSTWDKPLLEAELQDLLDEDFNLEIIGCEDFLKKEDISVADFEEPTYSLIVECENEEAQEKLYKELKKNYKVKPMTG